MAAVVVLGLAFFRLEKYLAEQRPIAWRPFSRALLEEKLAAGSPVFLKVADEWTGYERQPGVPPHPEIVAALETPRVRRLLRSNGIVPMRADPVAFYYLSAELHQDLIPLGLIPYPAVAVFPAGDNAKPVRVENRDLSESKVIEAIHRAIRRPR
jgi:hypothetical protein